MGLPRAILCDLDDTILTEGERHTILLSVAEQLRDRLHPHSPAKIADAVDTALEAFWLSPAQSKVARLGSHFGIRQARDMVISRTLGTAGLPEVAATALEFSELFSRARAASTRMYDGARTTLEVFRRLHVRLALVTNGAADIQRQKIERFGLASLFDHVQIEGELGFGKPEERAYLHAMEALDVDPAKTWMVGDNLEWEVAAPQRLGIHAIWHDHRGKGLPPDSKIRPDHIIRQFSELLTIAGLQ